MNGVCFLYLLSISFLIKWVQTSFFLLYTHLFCSLASSYLVFCFSFLFIKLYQIDLPFLIFQFFLFQYFVFMMSEKELPLILRHCIWYEFKLGHNYFDAYQNLCNVFGPNMLNEKEFQNLYWEISNEPEVIV